MMRWKQAMKRDVVDTEKAETIGKLSGMVADPSSAKIVAMVVGDQIISWTDANGIGADAVTVASADMLRLPESDLEIRSVEGATDPTSKQVLTEDGHDIGSVADIEFDPESGAILQLVLGDDEIAGSRLIGIGSYAVIVASPDRASASPEGLGSLSKQELYEQAKTRDIDGRSTMSKKELISALS